MESGSTFMTQDIYMINNLPGTAGNMVSNMIHSTYFHSGDAIVRDDFVFDDAENDQFNRDWFYQHWSLNTETTSSHVCNIMHLPDFDNQLTKYPDAKMIVITHDINDCELIANNLFQTFFIEGWVADISRPAFTNILLEFPQFFSDQTASPLELTNKERQIFIKILGNQTFLSGFHNITIPDNPNVFEITLHEILYSPATFRSKLETIMGRPLGMEAIADYNGFLMTYTEKFFIR